MGKENDKLLMFLSSGKPDPQKPSGDAIRKLPDPNDAEENCPSWSFLLAFVASSLLALSLLYISLPLCTPYYGRLHADESHDVTDVLTKHSIFQHEFNEFPGQDFSSRIRQYRGDHKPQVYVQAGGRVSTLKRSVLPRFRGADSLRFRFQNQGRPLFRDGLNRRADDVSISKPQLGRLLLSRPLRMKYEHVKSEGESVASFNTTFVFSTSNTTGDQEATGDSLAFVMLSRGNVLGMSGENSGSRDRLRTFAIKFDTSKTPMLHDSSSSLGDSDENSMVSVVATDGGFWTRNDIHSQSEDVQSSGLSTGHIQAWVEFDGTSEELTVSMSPILGLKPVKPLLKQRVDLSRVLKKFVSVGFSAPTGDLTARHLIHSWQFDKSRVSSNCRRRTSSQLHPITDLLMPIRSREYQSSIVSSDPLSKVPLSRYPRRPSYPYSHLYSHEQDYSSLKPDILTNSQSSPVFRSSKNQPKPELCRGYGFSGSTEGFVLRGVWALMGFLLVHFLIVAYQVCMRRWHAFFQRNDITESDYIRIVDP